MELQLIRAQFPQHVMAQLYLKNKLLCIYVGVRNKKRWIPIAALPDGRYSLKNPGIGKEDWTMKITPCKSRKSFWIKVGNGLPAEPVAYDEEVPLYLTWGNGKGFLTDLVEKNLSQVTAAISKGEKVYLNISTQNAA